MTNVEATRTHYDLAQAVAQGATDTLVLMMNCSEAQAGTMIVSAFAKRFRDTDHIPRALSVELFASLAALLADDSPTVGREVAQRAVNAMNAITLAEAVGDTAQ